MSAAAPSKGWIASIAVLLVCMFSMHLGGQMVQPIIGIYLLQLGATEAEAVSYAGFMNAGAAIMMMVAQPMWGALADRKGSRQTIIRALAAIGLSYGILAVATEPWHIVGMRLFQGVFGGATPAMIAMGAMVLPPTRLTAGLGLLQLAQSAPQSLAPLLGAISVSFIGYKGTFALAAAGLGVVSVVAYLRIREPVKTARQRQKRVGVVETMKRVAVLPGLRTTVLTMMVFQGIFQSTNQMMPLQLYAVSSDQSEAAFRVGVAFAANALGTTVGAWAVGWLARRFSSRFLVGWSVALAAATLVPMFWFQGPIEFPILRFLLGLALGGALPALRAALTEQARPDEGLSSSLGSLYGFSGSAQQAGTAVGAALMSLLANALGLTAIYMAGGLILVVSALVWALVTRGPSWHWKRDLSSEY